MSGQPRVVGQVAKATVLRRPGRYGDGPVHIRVDKARAGVWRPPFDHQVEVNDWRCACDPSYDYVKVGNTHNAFIYIDVMISRGVPAEALSVVRMAHGGTTP